MEETKRILDGLLEQRIITGYNLFDIPINRGNYNFVLSNLHETEAYVSDVKRDFESLNLSADFQVRNRRTSFCWESNHRFRDDNNRIYPNIVVRRKGEIINLENIQAQSFLEAGYREEFCNRLICENKALEINIACHSKEELFVLIDLFKLKYQKSRRQAWRDAYETPAVIIEGEGLIIKGFEEVVLLKKKTLNYEASFLIPKNQYLELNEFQKQIVFINEELIQYIFKEIKSKENQ